MISIWLQAEGVVETVEVLETIDLSSTSEIELSSAFVKVVRKTKFSKYFALTLETVCSYVVYDLTVP